MAKSNYLENKVLDHFLGTTESSFDSTIFIGLFSSDPTDAGSGTEISGNGYARQSISFNAGSGGTATNSGAVEFTASGGAWSTVTHFGIFDAVSSGNLLYHGALSASKTLADTDTLKIASAGLSVTES